MKFLLKLFLILSILILIACQNEANKLELPSDNTVKVRIGGDPESLSYLYITDSKAIQIIRQIFLPLVDFEPETYTPIPILAKSLPIKREVLEGEFKGTIAFQFEIRKEATWFNGDPVTGQDYLFTIKALFNPHKASPYANQFKVVKDIIVDSSNEKKFTIYSDKYMMAEQAFSNLAPLPRYIFDPKGILNNYTLNQLQVEKNLKEKEDLKELADNFNSTEFLRSPEVYKGSGPYHLTSWTTGQEIKLSKRPNWWGESLSEKDKGLIANPSTIVFKIIPDMNAAISLMKNKELDVIAQVDWTTFLSEKDNSGFNADFNFYTPDRFVMRIMNFNTTNNKLEDKRVRRAIAHLFDRNEIFRTVYHGSPKPVVSPIYPSKEAYNDTLKLINYDIDKAKKLLNEAGWEDTNNNGIVDKMINGERRELEIELSFGSANKDYGQVAGIFSSNALEAGVKIIPNSMESSSWFQTLKSKSFEMTFSGLGDYPFNIDPTSKWSVGGSTNYTNFGTAESDAIIKELVKTIDDKKQNELLKRLQVIIYEEQPCVFICAAKDRIIANKKFGEITLSGISPGFFVNELNPIKISTN